MIAVTFLTPVSAVDFDDCPRRISEAFVADLAENVSSPTHAASPSSLKNEG
jgi:hypothetical protein